MSPFGKIFFGFLGLYFVGFKGFLVGLLLGHILIDKSVINKQIGAFLDRLDTNCRLVIPYRFYKIYDKVTDIFSKPFFKFFKHVFDIFFDRNLIKILGAVIGFYLDSSILFFSGLIIGWFLDRKLLERSLQNRPNLRFWRHINPLKLALDSKEAREVAFIQSMAALSGKICKSDGKISEPEIKTFQKLFSIANEQETYISNIFYEAQQKPEDFERYADQIRIISKNNLELKENAVENLFKIASAEGFVADKKIEILRKISGIIGLPEGNFEVIKNTFQSKTCSTSSQDYYQVLGVFCNASDAEIKQRWKELTSQHHPDKIQSGGGSVDEIRFASEKMSEINHAYQNIMKSRQIK